MKKPALGDKDVFNPSETAEFYGLSRRKFFRFLDEATGLPFIAMYNTRTLIIRAEFETFLRLHPQTKEALKNGKKKKKKKA